MRPTRRLVVSLAKEVPFARVESFDGSSSGSSSAATTIRICDPAALIQIIRSPRLGLARAWVTGQVDIQGDIESVVSKEPRLSARRVLPSLAGAALRTALIAGPNAWKDSGRTTIEYSGKPGGHSSEADSKEIEFHYDRSTDFYRTLLGPTMAYSCAIFDDPQSSLEHAQSNKLARIARKLELGAQSQVLDLGCGWGCFIDYAIREVGCSVTGVTASRAQYEYICSRQLKNVNVINADYRQLEPMEGITAVVSIGMYEHVGRQQSKHFFRIVKDCLPGNGRFLNQAIIRTGGSKRFRRGGFMERYIFPNADILPLQWQLRDISSAGLTVLSVEHFGPHYATTLRRWRSNLEQHWDQCISLVGAPTVRAWQIYLAGAATKFDEGSLDLVQVLISR